MNIQRIEEFRITLDQKKAIQQLFAECFPGYPKGRTYFKQLPNFRYLVFQGELLIAHLAVEHRMIALDQIPYSIFGVVDICVDAQFRKQNIAANLLKKLEELGKDNSIDFIILTASDNQLYLNNGYQIKSNTCRWLFINDHQTLGVKNHHLSEALLVKSLGDKEWSAGIVDFLGTVF